MLRAETPSGQIVLDRLTYQDADVMVDWAADAATMDALGVGDDEPVREYASITGEAKRIADFESDASCIVWGIRKSQRLVGQVWIDTDDGNGELSYIIGHKSDRRQGLAFAAAKQVLSWAKASREFNSLGAWCTAENLASQALLRKLGMHYISTDTHDQKVGDKFPSRLHFEL